MEAPPTAPSLGNGQPLLRANALGTTSLVFLVLAAAAPMVGFAAIVPLVIGFGVGVGAPGIFVVTALALFCFAVGYAAMSRHMSNAGAFYSYIARGLGTRLGLSGAYVAVLSYTVMLIATLGLAAFFCREILGSELGIHMRWEIWVAILIATLAVLGFRRVDLNAFVLSTIFSLEIAIILVLDVAILADKGLGAFTLQAFNPSVIFSGAPGVALTFAFGTFIGFEATAIFAEETKNPKKTVPRATYIAVALVGTFFAISSWALIAGVGADRVQAVAAEDPGSFSFAAMQTYVGSFGYHAMNILMVTSLFGTALGLHNAGARYLFALSRDGVMPRQLSRTHPAHNSPWLASVSQLAFVSIVVAIFALAGADPFLVMATSFAGVGILGILALQTMVGFAVIAFFWRHAERHWFRTVVAPLLGSAAMIGASVLIVINYALVGQTSSQILNKAPWILIVTAIGGAAYATLLKVNRPDKYAAVSAALVTDSLDEDLDAFASGETSRERPGAPGRGHAIPVQQE